MILLVALGIVLIITIFGLLLLSVYLGNEENQEIPVPWKKKGKSPKG